MALTDNLVGYWKLDESSGNATDEISSFSLVNNGTVGYSAAKINNGADFGTSNSTKYFTLSPSIFTLAQLQSTWSFACWFYLSKDANADIWRGYFHNGGSSRTTCRIRYNADVSPHKMAVDGYDGSAWGLNSTNTPSQDEWHYIVVTSDGTTIRMYIDNGSEGSLTKSIGNYSNASDANMSFGRDNSGAGGDQGLYWDGLHDEYAFWTKVLSSDERTALYNSGAGLAYPFTTGSTSSSISSSVSSSVSSSPSSSVSPSSSISRSISSSLSSSISSSLSSSPSVSISSSVSPSSSISSSLSSSPSSSISSSPSNSLSSSISSSPSSSLSSSISSSPSRSISSSVSPSPSLAPVIVDSYSETNASSEINISSNIFQLQAAGQSFTGDGGTLASVKFYLKKGGLPTGNAVAKIYTHSGTYGTSSVPTGSALATSDTFDVSTLTTSLALVELTFSGAEKITLTNNVYYIASFEFTGGDGSNYVAFSTDSTSSTHSGNYCSYNNSTWSASAQDAIFYVYRDEISSPSSSVSPSSSLSSSISSSISSSPSTSASPSLSISSSISSSVSPSSSLSSSTSSSISSSESSSISSSPSSSISSSPSSSLSTSISSSPSISISSSISLSPSSSTSPTITNLETNYWWVTFWTDRVEPTTTWTDRTKPTTSWTDRTKPTTTWTDRTKPTTNWTDREKPTSIWTER